jgi:transposase
VKTLSLDLRQRILKAYDRQDSTRNQVARRFDVSVGMVKKLLSQRRRLGDIRPQHHRCGRKPLIDAACCRRLQELVASRPDATLQEMREALGLDCTLVAIHYVLIRLGLTYKKRRSMPANKDARMWPKVGAAGAAGKGASTRGGLSSWTSRRSKRT